MNKNKYYIVPFVLGLISIIYGILVASLASGTLFFAVWIIIGLILIGFAYLISKNIWKKIPSIFRIIIVTMVIVALSAYLIIQGFMVSHFNDKAEAKVDYLIVLGAQVKEDGPSAVLKYRLDEAIEYLNANPNTICIVSGGKGTNEPLEEAEGMAKYLVKNGIEKSRIIKENKSLNTKENIINSKKLMEDNKSVAIVTNDFHMFRALIIAKDNGLANPQSLSSTSAKLYLPNNMLREFMALIKYYIL